MFFVMHFSRCMYCMFVCLFLYACVVQVVCFSFTCMHLKYPFDFLLFIISMYVYGFISTCYMPSLWFKFHNLPMQDHVFSLWNCLFSFDLLRFLPSFWCMWVNIDVPVLLCTHATFPACFNSTLVWFYTSITSSFCLFFSFCFQGYALGFSFRK